MAQGPGLTGGPTGVSPHSSQKDGKIDGADYDDINAKDSWIFTTQNISAIVQLVMANTYMVGAEELLTTSKKLQFFNNVRRAYQENIQAAYTALAQAESSNQSTELPTPYQPPAPPNQNPNGVDTAVKPDGGPAPSAIITVSALNTYIQTQENALQAVGGDVQLMTLTLQNQLQTMQQNLSAASQVSKSFYDTLKQMTNNI
jgi:hypothetical protein